MSRARQTRVFRRTVELGGPYHRDRLCGTVQRAFASGKTVRHDDRRWHVHRFETETKNGVTTWRALLVNEEPAL